MTPKKVHRLQSTALAVTRWVGSPHSIVVHTIAFIASFAAVGLQLLSFDRMLLILTTIVSLEAIYLAIFIQMTINVQADALAEVEEDIDEMQEDVGEIQEDIDELQEDVEEISEEEKKEEADAQTLKDIHANLQKLMHDVERLQR